MASKNWSGRDWVSGMGLNTGVDAPRQNRMSRARLSGVFLAVLFLGFCGLTFDSDYGRWGWLTVAMGVAVLAAQMVSWTLVRIYALWFAFFYVAQCLASLAMLGGDFKTLPPKMDLVANVVGGLPGISGEQHITTDKHGFRTNRPVAYNQKSTMPRIFAIGGSTTEDIFLDDKATWTYLAAEKLSARLGQPVEMINTGVSGLRARHHLATLRTIAAFHPDLVIFMIGVNDWNHHIREHFKYLDAGKDETWRPDWLKGLYLRNSFAGLALQALLTSHMSAGVPAKRLETGSYFTPQRGSLDRKIRVRFYPKDVSPAYAKTINRIMKECSIAQFACLFLTQPHGYQDGASKKFRDSFWMTPPNRSYTLDLPSLNHVASMYNRFLLRTAQKAGHSACDIAAGMAPSFRNFYDDVHFNEAGARQVAALLLPCLLKTSRWPGTNSGAGGNP